MFTLIAQITNPVVDPSIGSGDGGQAVATVMAGLFRTLIMLGGLALFLYTMMGGLSWITASGDKTKIEVAKERIQNGIIGMAIMVAVVALSIFLSDVFGFEILNPTIPTPN
ncbi:hypothetical protein ACFL1M_02570 [Patescibacteria group bacterium]